MTRRLRGAIGAFVSLAILFPAAAAEPFDTATKSAIQDVIKKQLDSFARNDAESAEFFATPAIREKFSTPERFLDMVKKNYAVLVRPKSTQFGETNDSPHGPLQKMTVVATDGSVWTAIYALQKIDGSWKISGCGLKKEEGQQAI